MKRADRSAVKLLSATGAIGPTIRRARRWGIAVLTVGFIVGVSGCRTASELTAGDLRLTSVDRSDLEPINLTDAADLAIYRVADRNTLTILLIQGEADRPRRVAVIEMFWDARAGRTPVARTATNATVRIIDFESFGPGNRSAGASDRQDAADQAPRVGIYAGGGFLRLFDDPRDGQLQARLRDFDVRLTDRSEPYIDRLGRGILSGRVDAARDDARVNQLMRQINQRVSAGLGYPRLVRLRGTEAFEAGG